MLLGSNINNPENNIDDALLEIEKKVGAIIAKSRKISTKPVEFDSFNIFCNIAIRIKTQFSPFRLLAEIKTIERSMGRLQDSSDLGVYNDRIIDIDIILYNNIRFISRKLVIPHAKNLYERDFAMEIIKQLQ
ncbi:2-amino-4-hydroxy-6-hydroxymethyldihydropteridine diphosphokinase [Epilithonimonas vandammei]|uniref:2-amino-4-hydroxy-6- hydroxymethyldihydropteridine diphosphokinase n=1 Tax=Epilithonimonas vandammei TaxID=2487072 RepID=UPI0028971397|nr:2-amino-4-hydroxy-6-hydroxymethyldihydropteridine diphosphokinase [Epilithonimonas vandammei]